MTAHGRFGPVGSVGRFGRLAAAIATLALVVVPSAWAASGGQGGACTRYASSAAEMNAARPGDVVCLDTDLPRTRLSLHTSGTADQPITYAGRGHAVDGIDVEANHVVVQRFTLDEPEAPGIEVRGDFITVRHNTVTSPRGGDGDGLRFFGNDLRILRNTISDTSNSDDRHADCMQTFADDTPPSQRVLIEGNRCERVDNMCLMAEGPNDGEGDGDGTTSDFTIRDNFCETLEASQTLMFEDVQNCVIEGNRFAASPDHAIGLAIHSTGAHVRDNRVSPGIRYQVGIDESSLPGYRGPEPGGPP